MAVNQTIQYICQMEKKHDLTIEQAVERIGFSVEKLGCKCRSRELAYDRKVAACVLYDLGFTQKEIGSLMNRQHSSVFAMISTSHLVEERIVEAKKKLYHVKEEEQ